MTTTVTPLCATADSEMLDPFGHSSRMLFHENSIVYVKLYIKKSLEMSSYTHFLEIRKRSKN